jgi:hypothetical protein
MPEEFSRALSLIIQREGGGDENNRLLADSFKLIKNCLNIQYAQTESDMYGAEGYFTFSKNSMKENLLIFVSPKYQAKDDLLTAILLSHEISHALFFVGNYQFTCFENEAHAFENQYAFMLLLNASEKESLVARTQSYGDVYDTLYTIQQIINQKGNTWNEQALNYVKKDKYYIQQCSSQ